MEGFCRLWIPNSEIIAKPLNSTLKEAVLDPFNWNRGCQQAFQNLKGQLTAPSVLATPDLEKFVALNVAENQGRTLDLFLQKIWRVSYLSISLTAWHRVSRDDCE